MLNDLSRDGNYSWFRLSITLLIGMCLNIGMWSIVIVLPEIQEEFGFNRGDISILFSFTMVGFASGNYLLGKVVDQSGIVFTLVLSSIIVLTGFLISSLTNSFVVLSGCHILIGFGTAAGFGPLMSDISFWFSRYRGIAVSVAASGNYLSGILWPSLVPILFDVNVNWRDLYLFFGTVAAVFSIPCAFLLKRKINPSYLLLDIKEAKENMAAKQISPFLLMGILTFASISCCVAMSMPQIHIVALCVDMGFGSLVGTQMLSLMLLGGIVSRLLSGVAVDYFGGVRILLIGSSLQCLALFLYLPFDGLISLYIVSLVFGLAQGGIVPSYAVIIREYLPPENVASKVGLVMMATIFGMAFGGWFSGYIFDMTGSYSLAFWNGIIWNFLNIGLVLFLLLRKSNRTSPIITAT